MAIYPGGQDYLTIQFLKNHVAELEERNRKLSNKLDHAEKNCAKYHALYKMDKHNKALELLQQRRFYELPMRMTLWNKLHTILSILFLPREKP